MTLEATEEKFITDKAPLNFLGGLDLSKYFFPNAKIIHCVRDPKDNCLSIYIRMSLIKVLNWTYSQSDTYLNIISIITNLMKFWNIKIPNFIYNC